jgi:hypothetical protein
MACQNRELQITQRNTAGRGRTRTGEKPAVLWGGETDLQAMVAPMDEYSMAAGEAIGESIGEAAGEKSHCPSEQPVPVAQHVRQVRWIGVCLKCRNGLPKIIRRPLFVPAVGRDDRKPVQVPSEGAAGR